MDSDIALLFIDPVTLVGDIGTVCLPEGSNSYAMENATVVGWGVTEFNGGELNFAECVSSYHINSLIDFDSI